MAARSIWSGSISFGLVNIPVKLFTAVREQRIHFHMLHDQDKVRLQRKMVCPADGQEVHPEHIVKGYEVAPEQYVIVREEEMEEIAPEGSRNIEIQDFVDLADIDPIHYDRPYYLGPGDNAARPYALLAEAMESTKKVGIARFVMRSKEYLCALRSLGGAICLSTMHFAAEVVPLEDVPGLPVEVKVDQREVKVAQQLIESLSTEFDPTAYRNEHHERMVEMLERKARGEEVHVPPQVAAKPGRVVDLMSALEASLAQARGENKGSAATTATKRKATAKEKPTAKEKEKPAASHKGETRRKGKSK